jgi:TetR/AcrR family transcriptional regulator, mexJK operon transcriptional repressor
MSEANSSATKSATRTRSRSEEKRHLIMEAAADLFMEQGFDITSMGAIAERAEVSKQTVYSHFGSKEKVFVASVENRCMMESLEPDFFCEQRPIADMLLELARRFHRLLMSEGGVNVMRFCESNAATHPQLSELFYNAGPDNLQKMLVHYLAQKAETGELNIDNPHFAANQLIFMFNAESPMRRRLGIEVKQSEEEIDEYLKSCVALFLRGYSF